MLYRLRGAMHARLALKTQLKIAPQQVMASTLLQAALVDLDQLLAKEVAANPALERVETTAATDTVSDAMPQATLSYLSAYPQGEATPDLDDWTEQLTAQASLIEQLTAQLAFMADGQSYRLAVALLACLDDHGYLRASTATLAQELGVDATAIEAAIQLLHALEPPGIGARDLRECLQLQCAYLAAAGVECRLACRILSEAWEAFTKQQWSYVARKLQISCREVAEAQQFVRRRLYPYPLALVTGNSMPTTAPARADLIIRQQISADSSVYSIEIPNVECYQLRVNDVFVDTLRAVTNTDNVLPSERVWLNNQIARARQFIAALHQRWATLYRIGEYLIVYQADFLAQGALCLKPLTQAMVAAALGLDESTVSRAVHDKYVQLPDGRLLALTAFFDHTLPAKETMRQVLAAADHPLSDQEIADCLHAKGIRLARRTVAKYREQLKIPVSYCR
ncbi:MAG: RNA polymerase sigma-54 factor [Caldilinea sp. CFX5]|nr:RNA polymerase sigma-54 factor [Caldilinea sp. CFX5]